VIVALKLIEIGNLQSGRGVGTVSLEFLKTKLKILYGQKQVRYEFFDMILKFGIRLITAIIFFNVFKKNVLFNTHISTLSKNYKTFNTGVLICSWIQSRK
jgi:hypothetical protein